MSRDMKIKYALCMIIFFSICISAFVLIIILHTSSFLFLIFFVIPWSVVRPRVWVEPQATGPHGLRRSRGDGDGGGGKVLSAALRFASR